MEIKKSYIGKYFKKSVLHLFKSRGVFLIISVIEALEVLVCLINFEEIFFYFNQNYYETKTFLKNILLQIIPYPYYFNFQKASDGKGFDRNYIAIVAYFMLLVLFFVYLVFGTNEFKYEKNTIMKILDKICINFFDLIFFRLLPLYGYDCISRGILRISAKSSYSIFDLFIQFILLFFFFITTFTHIYYFRNVCTWNNFKVLNSYINAYPYDKFFSQKYDMVYFSLKLMVSLCKCYLEYNDNYFNIVVIYITFIYIALFYSYALYVFYIVFVSQDALYIYMNFSNKLRIFYILFTFECLIVRLALHTSGDHIPYIIYVIILVIFDIYLITTKFNQYLYTTANTSQNHLAVCWFVQSNDINKQDFIIEWISNHKNKCILDSSDCPICSVLKKEFDIYSDEHLLQLNKEKNENQFLNINNKSKNKNRNEMTKQERKTLISNMFPPFKFFNSLISLALRYKKRMTKEELIRLDFIQLTTLFLNEEKDIDFIIFNQICHCLMKYKKKSQILMTFILIFDLLRMSEKFCNQKYEMLQKNEELRNSLTLYLKEYEEFILYKEKTPLNYYDISCHYKAFKDLLITIHMYFKKNIECNYDLILMRYIYETLINSKYYHIQPFDLNNYSEFLEFHFNNCRTFLLKYNIEHGFFFIIKASKEILKFQGNRFNSIFPQDLRKEALNKFKSQLNDMEEKDSKPIFEFVIDSNIKHFGFIESFKMNYVIYPTNLINELFIQANYRIGYNNLIIFAITHNISEILFSYSFQLYKFFGLTPQDISLLYNYGIQINFENIFNKRNIIPKEINKEEKSEKIDKNDKNKAEYIFRYKDYNLILKEILTYDIIKESQNYAQIVEKQKQFEIFSKEDKEIIFQIYKKWECKTDSRIFNIYVIKEIKKKRLKKNLGDKDTKLRSEFSHFNDEESKSIFDGEESENDDEDKNDFDYGDDLFEGKGMTMAGSIMSSASFTKASDSMDSTRNKGKKDEKAEEKKIKQQQLYKTVYIILGFGIMLIIISVIFLIMENIENIKFKELIDLFHTFHIYKRGIESMPLTILANYKYQIDDIQTNNLFKDYTKEIGSKYNLLNKVLLSDLLLTDTQNKLSSIITSFNDYQKELHNLEEGLSNTITGLQGKSYKLKVEEDKLYFYKLDVSLISIGREYLNVLSILLNNNSFTGTHFYLMSAKELVGNMRTVARSRTGEVSILNKNMILLLLTYPFLHDGLFKISNFILDQERKTVLKITTIYIIFYSILFVLHLILCLIGIIFLISFIKILKLIILNGNRLFEDKKFLEFQQKRLNQIKIMKNLYSENPMKIMDKIEEIDDIYKNKNRDELKKKTNDMQVLEYDKNYVKEEDKGEKIDNDLLSKSNSQKTVTMDKKETLNVKNIFSPKRSVSIINENDKNNSQTSDKEELNSIKISQKVTSINKKMKYNQFYKIITLEFIFLFLSFAVYFIYSIIMLVLVILGINKLYILIDYVTYNDLIDGYLYDNTNAIIYIIETNATSVYYGNLIDNTNNKDYIKENIDLLYDAIANNDIIEEYKERHFVSLNKLINTNCSDDIIDDESLRNILAQSNISYRDYFDELCIEFPVASTGTSESLFFEIIYLVGQIYRRYEQSDTFFHIYQNNLLHPNLYRLYTITLTFLRLHRNYFYNNIIMKEVDEIIDYFSNLILIYLVICIIFEVLIFLVLYCGIIRQVKKKDNLFGNFIDSFKYD